MEIQQIIDSQAIAGFGAKPRPIEVEAFSAVLARKMESDLDELVHLQRPVVEAFQPGNVQTKPDRPAERHPSTGIARNPHAPDHGSDATSTDATAIAHAEKPHDFDTGKVATKSGSSEPEQSASGQSRPAAAGEETTTPDGASPIPSAAPAKAENTVVRALPHVVAGEASLPSSPGAANFETAATAQPGMAVPEGKVGLPETPSLTPIAPDTGAEPALAPATPEVGSKQGDETTQTRAVGASEATKLALIAADLIQDRPFALPAGQASLAPATGAAAIAATNSLPKVLVPEAPDMIPAAAKVVFAEGEVHPDLPVKAAKAETQPRPTPGPKPQIANHIRDAAPANGIDHSAIAARAATSNGPGVSPVPTGEAGAWNGSGSFESMDSATLPGWSVHLAQGAPAKRQEFLAALRQHLQELPAHEQISVQMQRALRDGVGRVTIQLHPAELGRIHVRMDIDEDKRVAASISAERPATLDLLQRDARLLERALQEAGLKLDANGMSFNLAREQAEKGSGDAGTYRGSASPLAEQLELEAESETEPALMDIASGLLNLRV